MRRQWIAGALAALALLSGCTTPRSSEAPGAAGEAAVPLRETPPRNIIVMISDGAGYSTLRATRLWTGKPMGVDTGGWRHAPVTVAPLSTRNAPLPAPEGLAQDPAVAFDAARSCDATRVEGVRGGLYGLTLSYPRGFGGYDWHRDSAPDSANTMSALMTGVVSYNNAINVDGAGRPVRTLAQAARESGRAVGVVTTAQVSDATPAAGGGAHAVARSMRREIAAQLFGSGLLTVLGGAGNPDWTDDATSRAEPRHDWIGADTWAALKAGAPVGGPEGPRWTLVEEAQAIRDLGAGRAPLPDRLAMVPHAFDGVQQYRGGGLGPSTEAPFATPLLPGQPALVDMALAALRRLDREPGGFLLVIEESNTDRAAHANNLGRTIEARLSFEETLAATLRWLASRESRASLADTLIVVTADHDHLLLGPDAARIPFQPVQPDGPDDDRLPDHRWLWNGHSNLPVPLFVRGPGAGRVLAATADGRRLSGRDRQGPMVCPTPRALLAQPAVGRALIALTEAPRRR
jgi:alkaline phosphatase